MQLLLIRHAQSANNHLYATTGADAGRSPDPDITELGQAQARALAEAVAAGGRYPRPTHLYCSLMRRTIQTAAPLADALDLPIIARPDAHEVPGPYEGPHAERVAHRGSPRSFLAGLTARVTLPDSVTEDGWYTAELEVDDSWHERAATLLADLREHHGPDDVVALVTHGWFGGVVIGAALGTAGHVWYHHQNTATTLLSWQAPDGDGEGEGGNESAGDGIVVLRWANRTDHLGPEQISE